MHVKRGAKFKAKWLLDEGANEIIKNAWHDDTSGGSSIQVVQQKFGTCKVDLRRQNWQKHGSFEKAIKEKAQQLEILQRNETTMDVQEIKKLQQEIEFLLEQEDTRCK